MNTQDASGFFGRKVLPVSDMPCQNMVIAPGNKSKKIVYCMSDCRPERFCTYAGGNACPYKSKSES
ncbi:MAG: hypothetical protein QT00_C0002G0308 [archaeon GW2011_AR5]|nr:MAG: hypothetical protein QT00_C0002G0308 [archaeon GW2011_AR5]